MKISFYPIRPRRYNLVGCISYYRNEVRDQPMNTKVDFKKVLKHLYNPLKSGFHLVDVPPMNYLMIDGVGDPNKSEEYQQAVEALYTMAYGIKFALKSQGFDHIVPPIEGLWWMENMADFRMTNKDQWKWTMMIMQPEWVTTDWVEKVRVDAYKKKKVESILKLRFENYKEGLAVQILYTGAYDDEALVIADMHEFIHANGYKTNGWHHEIYLGDPRKTPPDKLKTILRQPIHK
jgi:hypothetical protein